MIILNLSMIILKQSEKMNMNIEISKETQMNLEIQSK